MNSTSFFSRLPRWLRVFLIIASIITLIYWIIFITYKILCAIRVFGAFIFDKRNYWTFLFCIFILALGTLLISQFVLNLNPIGKFVDFMLEQYNYIKQTIAEKIIG